MTDHQNVAEGGAVSGTGVDSESFTHGGGHLIDRVRTIAREIGERVRRNLDPPAQMRVLCVDDNTDAADALAAVLGLLGYECRVCYDGASALAVAEEFRPDVCLLDLRMPEMDGMELGARLRAGAGPRPLFLVATTALGSMEDRTRTAVAGFHDHLVKPVDTPALVGALTRFGAVLGRCSRGDEVGKA
jgi:CheY-like chemotaxis protein